MSLRFCLIPYAQGGVKNKQRVGVNSSVLKEGMMSAWKWAEIPYRQPPNYLIPLQKIVFEDGIFRKIRFLVRTVDVTIATPANVYKHRRRAHATRQHTFTTLVYEEEEKGRGLARA